MSFYDPGGNTTERFFEAGECVPGNGTSLHIGTESLITALLVVNDTSAQTLDTLHGKVEFENHKIMSDYCSP